MRPSNYTQAERELAALRVMEKLWENRFCSGPELRSVIGWNKDDSLRLLWALVATGEIVRSDSSRPFVCYALGDHLLPTADPKPQPKAKTVERQDWASMITAIAV